MSIINYTPVGYEAVPTGQYVQWENLANDDTGQPVLRFSEGADKTVQVFGTFAGATLTIEGSNDPRVVTDADNAEWFTLSDPQGLPLTFTSAKGEVILESPRYIRPSVSSGAGASLTVITNVR